MENTNVSMRTQTRTRFLHLRSFKTPPLLRYGAVMSDEDDADCAFSMRKGVKPYGKECSKVLFVNIYANK